MAIKGDKKTIFIASSISEWGGSEELWSKTVPHLQAKGYHIVVYRPRVESWNPKTAHLIQQGVEFFATHSLPKKSLIVRAYKKIIGKIKQLSGVTMAHRPFDEYKFDQPVEVMFFDKKRFIRHLRTYKPKLVLVSQGGNFDGLVYAQACLERGIPYVIVSHKAIDFYWPRPLYRKGMRTVLANARQCFFVSQHNKRLTEEQFGIRLPNSQVVFNPIKPTEYIPYPDTKGMLQLCCIGRLHLTEKGQDILVRVLSQEKWKNRPLKVVIAGAGPDDRVLKEMVELLGATQIAFLGSVDDVCEVWKHSHALVLPSRSEGLPLVIVEAMMAGRMIITTDAGGNKELLQEGVTGFTGYPNEVSLDETLERAWQQSARWEEMGKQAAASIRANVPQSPVRYFADLLEKYI